MGKFNQPSDFNDSKSYTPVLYGATDDPSAVTYSTQVGRYFQVGKLCFFSVRLTTTSITKTTLTDALRVSLPMPSANIANSRWKLHGAVGNSTPVQNANTAYIDPNTSYLTFSQNPLTAAIADITYALLSLGVLTNTITFEASGFYETV